MTDPIGFGQGVPPPPHPAGPPAYFPPPRPVALPVEDREYHHFWRTPAFKAWKPALALVIFGLGFGLVSVLQVIPLVIDLILGRADLEAVSRGEISLTPTLLLGTNLALALLIPLAFLIQKALFGQKVGFIHSIFGRFRWGWAGRSLLVVLPIWILWLGSFFLTDPTIAPGDQAELWIYLAIILLTTPLQAAGEEYGFRGVLNRSLAAWFRNRWVALAVGAIVSSLAFMTVHGAGDPWLNVYYFLLGLLFCAIVWRTGGLEAAVVLHAVNNMLAFTISVVSGTMEEAIDRSAGAGSPALLISIVFGLMVLAGVEIWRRRRGWAIADAPGRELIQAQPSVGPSIGQPPVGP